MKAIAVGEKVAYSVQFLKSIGASHSPMAKARGQVIEVTAYSSSLVLAKIDWQNPEIPERVNVANLAKVGPNRQFCNVD